MQMASSCLNKLKERHPKLSMSQIAQKVGVGRSTLSRIENGTANPSLNTIIQMLQYLGDSRKLSDVLGLVDENRDPGEIKESLSHNIDSSVLLGQRMAELFAHPRYRMVLFLVTASCKGGTREEVRRVYGDHGIKILNELVKMGVLRESKDGAVTAHAAHYDGETPYTFEQTTTKDLLVDCITERYDPEKYGQGKNWLSIQTDSVDKNKVTKAIRDECKEFYGRIDKILRSKEYDGKDKIFVGMATDFLAESPEPEAYNLL